MLQALDRVRAGRSALRVAPPLAAGLLALATFPAAALDTVFDHRFDPSPAARSERRSVLEAAASVFDPLSDALAPIDPGGSFGSWRVAFRHPGWNTFFEQAVVEDLAFDAITFAVFVGVSMSQSAVPGMARTGTVTRGGTAFETVVRACSETGALVPGAC